MPISKELLPFSFQFFTRLAAVFAEEVGLLYIIANLPDLLTCQYYLARGR